MGTSTLAEDGKVVAEKKEIAKDTLKPITKIKSQLDRELQQWEVESTKDGQYSQGN